MPAMAIAQAFAAGQASPVALSEFYLSRIEAQTSPVFLAITRQRALAEAAAAEQRIGAGTPASCLDGVPIAWKDLIDLAGEPTTAASALYRHAPPAAADAPIAAHAAAAGMVCLGKVNLSEFAYSGLGLNPHFGTPINPHDPQTPRVPGGSSSGSAVAVAAGLAACAIGTDTGGSVRVPAAFNGLVGYKSSEGRIDKRGVFALSRSLDTVGPLARSVADCVGLDIVLRGAVATPICRRALSGLTVVVANGIVCADLEPAVAENFEASLRRLEQGGAKIVTAPLKPLDEAARLAAEFGTITAAEAYVEHRDQVDGPDVTRIDRRVVARIKGGAAMRAADLITLQRARAQGIAALRRQLDGALVAMPTTPHVAPAIAPLEADDALFHRVNLKTLRNTAIGNFLNLPGLAVPNGTGTAGMPTSFLLAANGGEDERLLGFGLAAEAAIRGEA
ncbi:amidase [Jiella sp. CQZ9-1]|uniref:Indoleacetamide hydrolase n=2 Tax=Jiella flava TaxID=2816857 RepID=A0A939JSE6_9HYPH|nr:amidase [Jiella flava]